LSPPISNIDVVIVSPIRFSCQLLFETDKEDRFVSALLNSFAVQLRISEAEE
jgi:hypothetical protein